MVAPLLALLLGASTFVQPPAPSNPEATPAADVYRIGAGDVLDVSVVDQPELTRSATVQHDGRLTLPLLGAVEVAGLSVAEARALITARLERDFLVRPMVDLRVREFASQFVLVLGEVVNPGRRPLRGNTRVLEVLIESGGFKASGYAPEFILQRTEGTLPDGSKSARFRLGGSAALSESERGWAELRLRNGDVLTVLPRTFVTVDGEVARPERYVLDSDLTLLGVLAKAGGLGKFASSTVRIVREPDQARTDSAGFRPCDAGAPAAAQCREVDVRDIRRGKVKDVRLLPNDTIVVSRRRF